MPQHASDAIRTVCRRLVLLIFGGLFVLGMMSPGAEAQPFVPRNAGLTGVDDGSSSWGDFDGDGDLDLVITGRDVGNNRTATIYENDVANGNGFQPIGAGLTGVEFSSSDWADFDTDNDPDLVITGATGPSRTARIYENDVANGNGFQSIGAGLTGVDNGAADWGDFDNDGDPDLVVTGLKTGVGFPPSTTIYENDVANGNGFQPLNVNLPGVKEGSAAAWADYNGDGTLDLAIAGENANGRPIAQIYRNDGTGSFTRIQAGLTGVRFSALAWGDLTGNGRPDLVVTGEDSTGTRTATVYENTSAGFSTLNAGLTGVTEGSVDIGDYDQDGDQDLVVTGLDATGNVSATIYENDGSGRLSPLGAGLTGVGTGSSEWGDFDNDGDLDLVVTGVNSNGVETATLYENDPSSGPPAPAPTVSNCITFEDLTAGQQFRPGDQFSSGGYTVQVGDYLQSPGNTVSNGSVDVDSTFYPAAKTGIKAFSNNATLQFSFNPPQSGLTFAYWDGGGTVNLGVNGDRRVAPVLDSLDGKTIGGATVHVRRTSSAVGFASGFVTIQGNVTDLAVGGQELGLDNICPGCVTFEDLPTGTRAAAGDIVSSGGVPLEIEPFTFSSGDLFRNGELVVRNDSLNSFPFGNKAFVRNVRVAPQFASPPDTVSFLYENFGGSLNLRVNGDLRFGLSDFASLNGQTVGGANIRVDSFATTPPGGYFAGQVTITGQIQDLAIGGQELFLDEICTHGSDDGDGGGERFVVTSTGNGADADPGDGDCTTGAQGNGPCTLRAALQETNALSNTAGPDSIHFDIEGDGPHVIRPQEPLPDVTDPVVIDGSTEPDFSGNPVVVIDGEALSRSSILNLETGSGGSSVFDLSLINSNNDIALFARTDDNVIDGVWIGLRPDGTVTPSNSWGLRTFGNDNQIGRPDRRGNVIVGASTGIGLAGGASDNTVQNNWIGETPDSSAAGNGFGVSLSGGFGAVTDNTIGGTAPNAGNRIAHNERGVEVADDATGNPIRGNRFYDQSLIGIDLATNGPSSNDAGDADSGPNRLQNTPEIESADYDSSANTVTLTYRVESAPGQSGNGAPAYPLTVDFYRTDADEDEGKILLHTDTYTAADFNSGPNTTITFSPSVSVSSSDDVVGTATDADGNTSEFSRPSQQLPVELASFTGIQVNAETVALTWRTITETNNAGFAVQRRTVGASPPGGRRAAPAGANATGQDASWETIGYVESKADGGTTTEAKSYRFEVEEPAPGPHQFRLTQRDLDGTERVHDPVTVDVQMKEALRLDGPNPNPVQSKATLSFAVREQAETTIVLYNVLGQKVGTLYQGTPAAGEQQTLTLSPDRLGLGSGPYFLRLRADGQTKTTRMTVVR